MLLTPFEISCIDSFNKEESPPPLRTADSEGLLRYGIWFLLRVARLVRGKRYASGSIETNFKSDGSPVTQLELDIESFARESLTLLPEGTALISEESEGCLPKTGLALALDPIDGTRSFLSQIDNFSTSLAFYQDGQPIIGMVINPVTGELGYAAPGMQSRLIQLALLGCETVGEPMPTANLTAPLPTLIHVHPSRRAAELFRNLYDLWVQDEVEFVRLSGGSPAYALMEAAKGHFIYINIWDKSPAAAYDLAAGILLVRGAGGDVVDRSGKPISFNGHIGPFIAGVWNDHRTSIMQKIISTVHDSTCK